MRLLALLITAVAALPILADPPQDDGVKKELKKLQGTWATVSIEAAGEKVTDKDKIKARKLTIKGDKYTLKVGDEMVQGTIEINPTRKPKRIDVKPNTGSNKGKTSLGIYELKGDNLKICLGPPGKERPTEFATQAEAAQQLVVYKREKP